MLRGVSYVAAVIGFLAPGVRADQPAPRRDQVEFFEAKVRPILVGRCRSCHGPEQTDAGQACPAEVCASVSGGTFNMNSLTGRL